MGELQNYPASAGLTDDDLFVVLNDPAGTKAVQKITAVNARRYLGPFLNVKDYGVVGDGTTDDAAAIQACIDAAISAGAYASVTRAGLATVFFPPGSYRVNTPLRVRSVQDFNMVGSGGASKLKAGAASMECVLDLNGVYNCSFRDFGITGGSGFSATRGLWVRWNGTNRSTSGNLFENVAVKELAFTRAGIEIGDTTNAGVLVDKDTWVGCLAAGARTVGGGDGTNYQAGFQVGEGTVGGNLSHTFVGCRAGGCRWGFRNDASEVGWFGGELSSNDYDVYAASSYYTVVKGLRSESSAHLLTTGGPAATPSSVSLEDIVWRANALDADNLVFVYKYGGTLRLCNVVIPYQTGKYPGVDMQNTVEATLDMNGVTSQSGIANFVIDSGSGALRVFVNGYTQINSSGDSTSATTGFGGPFNMMSRTLDAIGSISGTSTLTLLIAGGSATTDAQNRVRGESAGYYFDRQDGTQDWLIYRSSSGASPLFVRDLVNARMHATFSAGASNTAAVTELASNANVLGALTASGVVALAGTGGGSYVEFQNEQSSDPAAPSADGARVFTKDNGSGKTLLCVRFASGAVQTIATEP